MENLCLNLLLISNILQIANIYSLTNFFILQKKNVIKFEIKLPYNHIFYENYLFPIHVYLLYI